MRQHAPHAALEILDHVLVPNPQHARRRFPGRQHLIPVPHEVEIGPVVAGDVIDAVGEFLIGGAEQLLEIAEATGHGLTAHVDDRRVRQDQVDQADMPEVVRHLVDEEGTAQPAIGAGLAQEALAEPTRLLGGQPRQGLRIQRQATVRIAAAQLAGVAADFGQLLRALDAGMRGQDLLDQRRA